MAVQWTTNLAVGIDKIDDQHKEIFRRLNEFIVSMERGEGREYINKMLTFLQDYINAHFGTEEGFMSEYNYDEKSFSNHKQEHVKFSQTFTALKKRFEEQGATLFLGIGIQQQVNDWLLNHIAKEDKKFGIYLRKSGKTQK
ncbi:MAG: hemerythrin family protein [Candidatus Kuenenia sp.]|nr:hemerythrin family protein [Candidatus Kuenenia hertensis]